MCQVIRALRKKSRPQKVFEIILAQAGDGLEAASERFLVKPLPESSYVNGETWGPTGRMPIP